LINPIIIPADNRALREAPNAFDAISVNVANNPFFLRVINPLMLRVGILNSPIRGHFVCVDRFRVWRGVIVNELVENDFGGIRDNLQPNLSLSLVGSDSTRLT